MNNFQINHLNLSSLDQGTYEHESGIRINHRTLPTCTDLHWHEFFEIEFVVSGKGSHIFNGIEYELKAGSAFMLTPADFHKIIPIDNLELCTVMFPEHIIDSVLISKLWSLGDTQRILTLPPDKYDHIIHLFNLLFAELKTKENQKKDLMYKKYIHNLTECIFISFLSFAEKNGQVPHPHFNTTIHHALSYLHSHFRKNPSLQEIAAVSRYAPNYFCEVFKKTTGKTYSKYLNDLKLSFARQLLMNSNLCVTEICYASGFASLSNFLRRFKIAYGISPQSMRTNLPEQQ